MICCVQLCELPSFSFHVERGILKIFGTSLDASVVLTNYYKHYRGCCHEYFFSTPYCSHCSFSNRQLGNYSRLNLNEDCADSQFCVE